MQKKEKKHERRSTYRVCWYALLVYALISAGCAQQTSTPPGVKVLGSALYVGPEQNIGKADLMQVAEDVLAGMYFTIEKADVDVGLIRTRPLPGAQFFEFWRSDNVGTENTISANLHTIRRTVILDICRQNEQLQIGCEVQTQRLSLPERQISSSAKVYGMFSRSGPLLQRLILNPEQAKQMAWIEQDRDSRLETEILKRIEARILRRTSQQLHKTENQT